MANKDISTVDYTETFSSFFVDDIDDIKQATKDTVKSALGIAADIQAATESKADKTEVEELKEAAGNKADKTEVEELRAATESKADKTDVEELKADIAKNKTETDNQISELKEDLATQKSDLTTQKEELAAEISERESRELSSAIKSETEEGETLNITDSADYPLQVLHIYGRSTQDGEPTPDNPVEIVSAENPTVTVNNGGELSQTLTIFLGEPLRGIEGCKDVVCEQDGQIGVLRNVGLKRITGTETYTQGKSWCQGTVTAQCLNDVVVLDGYGNKYGLLATIAKEVKPSQLVTPSNKQIGIGINLKNVYLNLGFTNKEDTIDFIKKNNFDVLYPLATPKFEPFSDDIQKQYRNLKSYYGTTNIYTDTNATLKVKYVADTKGYIDRKFDELAAALVAQTSEQ